MQQEINATNPKHAVRIHGIDLIGYESGIPEMCAGRTIPLCQDDSIQVVQTRWQATYRDVFVLDEENRPTAVFNLTLHSLATQVNYDSLKALILQTAND
jgi:hypothetical protein